jgi:hypothetical protein
MGDWRYLAEHHGEPLKKELDKQLIRWGCACLENDTCMVNLRLSFK